MDVYNVTDATHERRRDELMKDVVKHMSNRGALVRAKASLRTLRDTTTVDVADTAAYMFVTGGKVAIGVVAVPALIAGTVLSAGALPVAAVVAGGFAYGMTRLITAVRHSHEVGRILAAVKAHLESPGEIEMTEANIWLGRSMLQKLISDGEKLNKEVKRAREKLTLSGYSVDTKTLVRELLAAESSGAVAVHPVDTRMRDVDTRMRGVGRRDGRVIVLHRLRRIRGYLVWLLSFTEKLKSEAFGSVGTARDCELDVINFVTRQVHFGGNHANCSSSLCYGPSLGDLLQTAASTPSRQASVLADRFGNLTPHTFETRRQAVRIAEGEEFSGEEQTMGQVASRIEAEAEEGYDALERELVDALGETAGVLAGELLSEFAGDLLSSAMERTRTSYRVNRPLMARVHQVQVALREQSGMELDREIAHQAGRNDLKALLRAFDKATLHYPKRISERAQKLDQMMTTVRRRAAAVRGAGGRLKKSPLYNCGAAVTLTRYLVKVYHYAEKQLIHAQFLNFGLDAVARQVFGVGAELATSARTPFSAADLSAARRGLRPTTPVVRRPPVDGLAIALAAARRNLRSTETRQVDPLVGIRNAERAADDLDFSMLSQTWITFEGLQNPIAARPGTRLLGVQQWQRFSSIVGFRTDLTRTTDTALQRYNDVAGRLLVPHAAGGGRSNRLTTARLSSATAEIDARLAVLNSDFKVALDGWLAAKADKAKSKRRDSVLKLRDLVVREIESLTRLKAQIQSAQRTRAIAGVAPIPEWLASPIEIEAEPDE